MRNKTIIAAMLSTVIGIASALPVSAFAEDTIAAATAEKNELVETGSLEVSAKQVRLIVGGAKGTGVLYFKGKKYKFKMSGASVGGVGVTKVDAVGTVYNLYDIKDFPGTYAGMGAGAALVEGKGASSWQKGDIVIKTKAKSEGVALNMGVNTVIVELVK